jgi:hypothetical protein
MNGSFIQIKKRDEPTSISALEKCPLDAGLLCAWRSGHVIEGYRDCQRSARFRFTHDCLQMGPRGARPPLSGLWSVRTFAGTPGVRNAGKRRPCKLGAYASRAMRPNLDAIWIRNSTPAVRIIPCGPALYSLFAMRQILPNVIRSEDLAGRDTLLKLRRYRSPGMEVQATTIVQRTGLSFRQSHLVASLYPGLTCTHCLRRD